MILIRSRFHAPEAAKEVKLIDPFHAKLFLFLEDEDQMIPRNDLDEL